jgi:hypothetical protein
VAESKRFAAVGGPPDPTDEANMSLRWSIKSLLRIQLGVAMLFAVWLAAYRLKPAGRGDLSPAVAFVAGALVPATLIYFFVHVFLSSRHAVVLALFVAMIVGAGLAQSIALEGPVGSVLSVLATIGWGLVWDWFRQRPSWMTSLAANIDRQSERQAMQAKQDNTRLDVRNNWDVIVGMGPSGAAEGSHGREPVGQGCEDRRSPVRGD